MTEAPIKTGVYNCPNCGAAATPESVRCAYCHSALATLICSSCFGAIFIGMKHCPWCGSEATAAKTVEHVELKCPRCDAGFLLARVGQNELNECPACGGLWLDNTTLQRICSDQEEQEAVMGFTPRQVGEVSTASRQKRTYIPCPECGKLMNRRQLAGCSGVIVDWCKAHGTWLDRDELRQVVQFILAGGLKKSREREKIQLEEERRNLREEKRNLAAIARLGGTPHAAGALIGDDPDFLRFLGDIWRLLRD
jgi:Zn-finger nucleic acid-binding protein